MAKEESMISDCLKAAKLDFTQKLSCLADKGYQGLCKLHPNSRTPQNRPREQQLSAEAKQYNRELAKLRVICEHINCLLKVFKILLTATEIEESDLA